MNAVTFLVLSLVSQAPIAARPRPQPQPLPQSVSPIVPLASLGVTGDPSKDATDAFEAALERAGQLAARPPTSGSPSTALVRLPGGVVSISRPLFVPTGVDVAGEGWATRIDMAGVHRYPALVYGIANPRVGEADRPDLFGVLDRTAAPRPGVRRGWSTAGELALQGQFTTANIGRWHQGARDYWEGVETLTLDVALMRPASGWQPLKPLLGCGVTCVNHDPRPWAIWTSPRPGWVVLSLATDKKVVGIAVAMPQTRVVHLSWQVDLRAGVAAVWANGVQVATELDNLVPGLKLQANEVWPLHVGRQGFAVATSSEPPTPFGLAGLHLSAMPRYVAGRVGSPQTRIDRQPLTDAFRYFDRSDVNGTVGFLPFDDAPGQRWLRWMAGDGLDELLLVTRGGQGGGKPCRLSDLAVWSRGPAVLLGAVLDWRGASLRLQSETAVAIGSIPLVMSYPIILTESTLSGGDAAVSLSQAIVALRDCKIEGQGRDGIRLRGASLDASHTFASFCPPQGRTFLRSLAGGEGDVVIRLDRSILDYEDRGPADALFVIQAEPQHPTTVRIRDVSAALTGPTHENPRPILRLTGQPERAVRATCVIEGVASGKAAALVGGGEGWKVKAGLTPEP